MGKCKIHLPGNAQCPYAALYEVTWTPHRLKPAGEMHREVCVVHLAPAVDQALDDSARGTDVRVKVAPR